MEGRLYHDRPQRKGHFISDGLQMTPWTLLTSCTLYTIEVYICILKSIASFLNYICFLPRHHQSIQKFAPAITHFCLSCSSICLLFDLLCNPWRVSSFELFNEENLSLCNPTVLVNMIKLSAHSDCLPSLCRLRVLFSWVTPVAYSGGICSVKFSLSKRLCKLCKQKQIFQQQTIVKWLYLSQESPV
jgi:hypothetical protein